MNILVASVFGFNSYSRGIMPDVLQSVLDENPEAKVYYLTNSQSFKLCYFNLEKNPANCYRCKTGVNNALELIEGEFTHLRINQVVSKNDIERAAEFFARKEIISLEQKFEEFEVGEATLSTYISRTRDRELVYVQQDFVKELAVNALALYLGTKRFLKEYEIDVVYNFNGRQDYVRAIFKAALACNLDCYNVEQARPGGYLEYFKNVLTHNISAKKDFIDSCWNNSPLSGEEKIEIGKQFFRKQRSGSSVIFPSHVKNQTSNLLPLNISAGKENYVLFTSSDDEFAALGDDFTNPLFKDQFEGIHYLVELMGTKLPDKQFYIRMHPNLYGLSFDYVQNIRGLHQKYPNIFVLLPEDKIDSYALMEKADKILTFGSTLGLEATYYQKPSVLLGKSFFYYSNVTYNPINKEEIESYLRKPLKPRSQISAIRFGFYYLQGGTKTKYYSQDKVLGEVVFKGRKIPFPSFKNKIVFRFLSNAFKALDRNRF